MNRIKKKIKYAFGFGRAGNKGFSLVELLISMSILGLIALSVCMIMTSGTNLYTGINRQSALSYQSQLTLAQIEDYFIDCHGVCEQDGVYYVLSPEDDGLKLYSFRYSEGEKTVYFADYSDPYNLESGSEQPLADNISSFSIDINGTNENKNASTVKINLEVQMGTAKYAKSQLISMRNLPAYAVESEDVGGTILGTVLKSLGIEKESA